LFVFKKTFLWFKIVFAVLTCLTPLQTLYFHPCQPLPETIVMQSHSVYTFLPHLSRFNSMPPPPGSTYNSCHKNQCT
jgi:hypothetical protein